MRFRTTFSTRNRFYIYMNVVFATRASCNRMFRLHIAHQRTKNPLRISEKEWENSVDPLCVDIIVCIWIYWICIWKQASIGILTCGDRESHCKETIQRKRLDRELQRARQTSKEIENAKEVEIYVEKKLKLHKRMWVLLRFQVSWAIKVRIHRWIPIQFDMSGG